MGSKATLDKFLDKLEQALLTRFSSAVAVQQFAETVKKIDVPALLISLDDFSEDPRQDEGTPLLCNFSLYCVVDATQTPLDVCNFAAEALRVVRKAATHGFDNVRRPEGLAAYPSSFSPDVTKYDAWVVTWEQLIVLPAEYDAGELVPFVTFHADHEQATDAPVASDTVTLPQ